MTVSVGKCIFLSHSGVQEKRVPQTHLELASTKTGASGHVALTSDVLQKLVLSLHGSYVSTSSLLCNVVSFGFGTSGSGSSTILPSVSLESFQCGLPGGGSTTLVKEPVTFPHMVTRSVCLEPVARNEAST